MYIDRNLFQFGDMFSSFATPFAGLMRWNCYDPQTRNLRPRSPCAQRRTNWNDLGNIIYDELFQTKKG